MRYEVLDLFSGAGGFSLGFAMAGYKIIGALDIDKWALDTFAFNHKKSKILLGDISNFSNEFLSDYFCSKPDIIIGGPPCQGYSICNKNAGDPKDPRNSLFREFLRFAVIFEPRILIMENVANIINAKPKSGDNVVNIIKNEFKKLGYFT
ncbi:DNA cytosine methyltransferase, partial [Helicobacter japonicus]|uniref:DNA cytosine methyltransferase n=1 Tax=Helicobacter japonicus TaxID=425400 RepID=UPI0023F14667